MILSKRHILTGIRALTCCTVGAQGSGSESDKGRETGNTRFIDAQSLNPD